MSKDHHSKEDAVGAADQAIGSVNEVLGDATGNHQQAQAGRNEVSTGHRESFIGQAKDEFHNVEDRVKGFFHHDANPPAQPAPDQPASTDNSGTVLDEISRDINNSNS